MKHFSNSLITSSFESSVSIVRSYNTIPTSTQFNYLYLPIFFKAFFDTLIIGYVELIHQNIVGRHVPILKNTLFCRFIILSLKTFQP